MSICSKCRASNPSDSRFCERCGAPMVAGGAHVTVGSAPDCEVVLRSPIISAHHAEFHDLGGGRLHVVDLSSTNGVFVNGQRVRATDVYRGDRVTLGSMWLDLNFVFQALKRTSNEVASYRPQPAPPRVAPQPPRVDQHPPRPPVSRGPVELRESDPYNRIYGPPDADPPAQHANLQGPPPYSFSSGYSGLQAAPGKIRHPVFVLVMSLLTFGIYAFYWQWVTFDEIRPWRGNQGWTGAMMLLCLVPLVNIVLIAVPFLIPSYVGDMYRRAGLIPPISGFAGLLWLIPAVISPLIAFPAAFGGPVIGLPVVIALGLIGALCWVIWVWRVQAHLNRFWESRTGGAY